MNVSCSHHTPSSISETSNTEMESSIEVSEEIPDSIYVLKIETNGNIFYADFEDNSSAEALKEKTNSENMVNKNIKNIL